MESWLCIKCQENHSVLIYVFRNFLSSIKKIYTVGNALIYSFLMCYVVTGWWDIFVGGQINIQLDWYSK